LHIPQKAKEMRREQDDFVSSRQHFTIVVTNTSCDCLDATMPQAIVNGRKRRQSPQCTTASRKRRTRSVDTTKKRDIAAQARLQNEMNIIQRNIPTILLIAIISLVRIRR
jgi:hypothetical protein